MSQPGSTPASPDLGALQSAWAQHFAFGLPPGSIRAILAILVIGSLAALTALHPQIPTSQAFRDLSFLILGSYFAHRRTAQEPQQTAPHPLFLPRGAVRLLMGLSAVAVIVFMFQRHDSLRPRDNPALYPVIVMIGFLLGVLSRVYTRWLTSHGRHPKRIWADLRATVALLAAAALLVSAWNDAYHFLPVMRESGPTFPISDAGFRHAMAAVVAFYFGSRS